MTYSAGKQSEVQRNYLSNLEMQIERLKSEVEELRTKNSQLGSNDASPTEYPLQRVGEQSREQGGGNDSTPLPDRQTHDSDPRDLVRAIGAVALESTGEPRFMGTSSGITFVNLVMGAIKCDRSISSATPASQGSIEPSTSTTGITSSLPPRHAADHIVDIYFQQRTPHFAILERHQVDRAIDNVYKNGFSHDPSKRITVEKDLFTVYMILAIGLCGITKGEIGRPMQSEGCFNSAIKSLDAVFNYPRNSLESLASILLLCQYVELCPSKGSLWQLSGLALRLCIEMGLHWEPDTVIDMDPAVLDERRRLFWTAYNFDRVLVITLGRPFGIVDQSTNVGFPNPWLDINTGQAQARSEVINHKCFANHVTALYKLQSEIKHVLYHQLKGPTLAFPQPDYNLWIRDIHPRLEQWKACIPPLNKAHPQSIFACQHWWNAMYNGALLFLHRPNPLVPCLTASSLNICFEISCNVITSIKTLHREGKIDVPWIWVHQLILAGLTMMYCVWHSNEIRTRISFEDLMDMTQRCSGVLAALAERFPGAAGCRDAFEMMSATTLREFVSKDSNVMPREETPFSRFLQTIQQQAPSGMGAQTSQPPRGESMMMLPDDPLDFGESLASAAQWPSGFGEFDMTMDSIFGNFAETNFGTLMVE